MKTIAQKVPAQPFASNTHSKQTYRIIGTTDMDGKGTKHAIADVDPFIFLDETTMNGDEAWPFPKHPHCGLVAMTYLLSGEIKPWDNHQGKAPFNNSAGGLYYINSGNGIIHEEEPIIAGGPLRWLQLWLNPGIYSDSLPNAFAKLVKPSEVPLHQTEHAKVRIILGEAFEQHATFVPDWPIQYLHITLQPAKQIIVPLQQADWNGFIYILKGQGSFGNNHIKAERQDCLILGNELSHELLVSNEQEDAPLEFVVLTGKPHRQPFYKLLSGGGALIAASEDKARAAMKQFEKQGERFGCS